MEFVLGLVFGAIFGVVADRVWARLERVPKLHVEGGFFMDVGGQGFTFTITNIGACELPPVTVCIYNPRRGSIFMFEKNAQGVQLPGQRVRHRCTVVGSKGLPVGRLDFYRESTGEELTNRERNEFAFRLVVESSDRIIYESKSIGNSFVRVFQKVRDEKNFECVTFEEMMLLQAKYEPWYMRVRERFGKRFLKRGEEGVAKKGVDIDDQEEIRRD